MRRFLAAVRRRLAHAGHNIIVHPIVGVLYLFGCQQWGDWVHDHL